MASVTNDREARFHEPRLASRNARRFVRKLGPVARREAAGDSQSALAFHRSLPGYSPTPLRHLPALARELGCGELWLKDESSRLGLPSFKVLGASWAVYCSLCEWLQLRADPRETTLADLRQAARGKRIGFVTATDGNHGRAVAHVAAMLSCAAHVLVPAGTARARVEAIVGEGATCEVWDGGYDDTVAEAQRRAGERTIAVPDVALSEQTAAPSVRVIEGYATILHEVDEQLSAAGRPQPDVVVVQVGVGALATAVIRHFAARCTATGGPVEIIAVEPVDAACAMETALAGAVATVPGPHRSVMAGLNCGTPTLPAVDALSAGVNLFAALPDADAHHAVRRLAAHGLQAGETGAAGVAGLLALKEAGMWDGDRACARVLTFLTEGVTDPVSYARSISADQDSSGRELG